jgi:NAD(P)-dependent dehydrogenase (short-subunit alcohol dehydrogenase family)
MPLPKITPGIALVTGASSGIGRSAAIALNEAGWTTVVCARRKDALEETVGMMAHKDKSSVVVADLGVEADVLGVFAEIKKQYGELHTG